MGTIWEATCAKCGLVGRATQNELDEFALTWSIAVGNSEDDYSSDVFFSPVMTSHINVCGAPVSVSRKEA